MAPRSAVDAIAILALLLHVFIAPIAARATFIASQSPTCTGAGSPAEPPHGDFDHHDATCCLAACAGLYDVGIAPVPGFAIAPPLVAAAPGADATPSRRTSARLDADFSARGPPPPV